MNGDTPEQPSVPSSASPSPDEPRQSASDRHPTEEPHSPWNYSGVAAPSSVREYAQAPTANPYSNRSIEVEWTASEFIAHSKGVEWFVALGIVTVVVDVLLYFWARDVFTVVIITIMAVLFGVVAARKPRVVQYRINSNGLLIGQKFFAYANFRAFAVIDDGPFSTLMFIPAKRLMPPISVYYEPDDEERILSVLGQYLPMEHGEHDFVDRLTRRIRF
ncbi:MAG TPA: hypothetical protein VF733_02995 [Candidatus Saccharimonadales bacterium]